MTTPNLATRQERRYTFRATDAELVEGRKKIMAAQRAFTDGGVAGLAAHIGQYVSDWAAVNIAIDLAGGLANIEEELAARAMDRAAGLVRW